MYTTDAKKGKQITDVSMERARLNIRIIQDFVSPGELTLSPGESTVFFG